MLTIIQNTLASLIRNKELVREMAWRELKGMNQGALLGSTWLVLNPLIQTAAYVLIVSFVFRQRLTPDSGPLDYALYVLAGMVPWQIMTRALAAAPSLIRERMELVKQVIYPIETLPVSQLIIGSCGSLVTLALLLVLGIGAGTIKWTILLLPIPFLLLAALILGISWSFMILGVLLKDLREAVSLFLGLLVFVSPVVASRSMVGEDMWRIIQLNPLTHIVVAFRDVFHAQFHPLSWLLFAGMALLAFTSGVWVIARTKLLINEYI